MIGRLDERLRLAAIGALVYFMASLQMVIRGMDNLWARLPMSVRNVVGPVAQQLQARKKPKPKDDDDATPGAKRGREDKAGEDYEYVPTNLGRGVVAGIIFVSLYVGQKGAPSAKRQTA